MEGFHVGEGIDDGRKVLALERLELLGSLRLHHLLCLVEEELNPLVEQLLDERLSLRPAAQARARS